MNSLSATAIDTNSIWLRSKKWDLFWITGSAVLVAFPIFLLLHYYFDHFLFFSQEDELKPAFAPARA